MRALALIPLVFSTGAFIIGFLCLFAGSKPNFMSDYEILTLNTSRIGQNLIQKISTGSSSSGSNPITNLLHNITSTITGALEGELSSSASSLAHSIGVEDFYSLYVLDYCEGTYEPGPIPNATLPLKDIHMNVTMCSPRAHYNFTPGAAIQATLNRTHTGITLQDLDWPTQIDSDFKVLDRLLKAFLIIYSIAVGLSFFTMVGSLIWLLSPATDGRRGCAGLTGIIAFLAFLAAGVASGLVTAVAVKGVHIIDKYGENIGVSANRSDKLLALTWSSVGCLLVASLVGCCGICFGGRRSRPPKSY